jgi:hypothetical protein
LIFPRRNAKPAWKLAPDPPVSGTITVAGEDVDVDAAANVVAMVHMVAVVVAMVETMGSVIVVASVVVVAVEAVAGATEVVGDVAAADAVMVVTITDSITRLVPSIRLMRMSAVIPAMMDGKCRSKFFYESR